MAHIRRKFVDIFVAQGSAIAGEAIKRFATLYAVEKQVRGLTVAGVELRVRQAVWKTAF